jgi:formylglycine-generating enzyme required for sulfatase activity
MPRDDDQSLGGEQTFSGKVERDDSPQSLGNQPTSGDVGGDDEPFDDGMEVVDLSARYTIEDTLGKGGMGEVLLAFDTRMKRKVAIKRMLVGGASSRTAVSRFLTEAQSMAGLDHDNIVDVYDYGRSADGPFLVMQYIDGGSLLDRCREGTLPVEEAVDLICQVCDVLTMCHDAGMIHRDIKPANILMTGDGSPRLTDFGLVKDDTIDGGQTSAGAVLGTLDFMPPEQRKDAALVDARSDLWSLAATLYQMVSGRSPRIIKFSQVPQALHDVLEKALEDEKDDRYQTAGEFKDALRATTRTASQPTLKPAAELGAGECPKCHTQNESNRKFCSECAAALRVSCLKCELQIPIWDKVCGDCGGKQSELAAPKLEEFARQCDQAEEHRREYRFENALQIARSLTSVEDERFAEHVPWAEGFVTATEAAWERERESAAAHFKEARTHREVFDYPSAIHTVESVPEAMRTSEVSGYLQQLESDHAESKELIKTISERVKRRDMKGLLEQVERAVELRGDRTDLHKLAGQLREREEKRRQQRDEAKRQRDEAKRQLDEACAEAKRLFDSGDAKGALAMIQSVPSDDLRSSDEQLRSELEEIVAADDKLTALVQDSKADGVLEPAEVASMWQSANDYLKMNPRYETIAGLQQKLEARIRKAPGKYAAFTELADFWPTQPVNVLSQLPSSALSQLPANVLSPVVVNMPVKSNSLGMKFKQLQGSRFTMGEGADAHQVTLTQPFELGVYEVTQEHYESVMGTNPSRYKGPQNPVEQVSWDDAVEFCRKLSAMPAEKKTGYVYRLPTEAEWEYACRVGTTTTYSIGDSDSELGDYAWYDKNSGFGTHPVGGKKPNAWGLYDMHGNVWEWCQDWYGYYPSGSVTDPTGSTSGSSRVLRGGSFSYHSSNVRSATRTNSQPDFCLDEFGFRPARTYNLSR